MGQILSQWCKKWSILGLELNESLCLINDSDGGSDVGFCTYYKIHTFNLYIHKLNPKK